MSEADVQRAHRLQAEFKDAMGRAETLADRRAIDATLIPTWSGPLADDVKIEEVDADGVPCIRLTPPGAEPGRVLLYLHGGGFVMGGPESVATAASLAARAAGAVAVLPRFRLAPEHLYPAMVDDVVTAYSWLIEQGVAPSGIVIAGESSGGGLVCATLLALREAAQPLPAAAVALSPMVDLEFQGETWQSNADSDGFLDRELARGMVPVFLADRNPHEHSAVNQDLRGLPPMLIQVGEDEVILDDVLAFAKKARVADVDVTLERWPRMFHLWHNFAFLPEAHEALEHIGRFVHDRTTA